MKIVLILSASVVLTITLVSARPLDPTRISRAQAAECTPVTLIWSRNHYKFSTNPAKDDYHSFRFLVPSTEYDILLKPQRNQGAKNKNYLQTRMSDDGRWNVTYTDSPSDGVVLTANGLTVIRYREDHVKWKYSIKSVLLKVSSDGTVVNLKKLRKSLPSGRGRVGGSNPEDNSDDNDIQLRAHKCR
ncbi:MAG: hypothetical protein JOS17DRAFT_776806 [Linnemannia elongata]|nr:MAG: hypothetical protein JOS17DRAFT_776806 [Linnemannia elongata]